MLKCLPSHFYAIDFLSWMWHFTCISVHLCASYSPFPSISSVYDLCSVLSLEAELCRWHHWAPSSSGFLLGVTNLEWGRRESWIYILPPYLFSRPQYWQWLHFSTYSHGSFSWSFIILAKLFIPIALSSCLSQFELVKPQVCIAQFWRLGSPRSRCY